MIRDEQNEIRPEDGSPSGELSTEEDGCDVFEIGSGDERETNREGGRFQYSLKTLCVLTRGLLHALDVGEP